MAEIYDFNQFKKNMQKKVKKEESIEMDILLSVMKEIYMHMVEQPDDIFDAIDIASKTEDLLSHDRSRFAAMFVGLVEYWNIGPLSEEEIPMDEEFERFPTVEDLCVFIDEKLTKNKR